jgi:hypothetical protein
MDTNDHQRLIEKLRRIEALFADRAATAGEKAAADEARDRILGRLKEFAEINPPVEYTFTLRNRWSHKLFVALLRRYNLQPYRYARQRYTTAAGHSGTASPTVWELNHDFPFWFNRFASEPEDSFPGFLLVHKHLPRSFRAGKASGVPSP